MANKELTPVEFTFHSFRHSQGSVGVQQYIFRYFDVKFGMQPDLHPSSTDRRRYAQYLGGTSLKAHIQYEEEGARGTDKMIIASFKSLRSYMNTPKTIRHLNHYDEQSVALPLLGSVAKQELRILGAKTPWAAYENQKDYGHSERLKQRVQSGQTSFLYCYGRDERTTGMDEFDQMYADMWETATLHLDRGHYKTLLENHAFAVSEAERLYGEPAA